MLKLLVCHCSIRRLLNVSAGTAWNRGSRGSSCSPNFRHGRAGHSSCSPKSLSLLHCDVKTESNRLRHFRILPLRGTFKNQKAFSFRNLRPSDPHQGLCPWTPLGASPPDPRYRLALHALAMAPGTACSPNFQTLPTPMTDTLPMIYLNDSTALQTFCPAATVTVMQLGHDSCKSGEIDDDLVRSSGVLGGRGHWAVAHLKFLAV